MKVAVVGSRTLFVNNLEDYLPEGVTEIVSGGARGIDTCAKYYARKHNLKYTEFLPEYDLYGKVAPLKRNDLIIAHADFVLIFWNGESRGSYYVKHKCEETGKNYRVIMM